jgi:hypothetical protein
MRPAMSTNREQTQVRENGPGDGLWLINEVVFKAGNDNEIGVTYDLTLFVCVFWSVCLRICFSFSVNELVSTRRDDMYGTPIYAY